MNYVAYNRICSGCAKRYLVKPHTEFIEIEKCERCKAKLQAQRAEGIVCREAMHRREKVARMNDLAGNACDDDIDIDVGDDEDF